MWMGELTGQLESFEIGTKRGHQNEGFFPALVKSS